MNRVLSICFILYANLSIGQVNKIDSVIDQINETRLIGSMDKDVLQNELKLRNSLKELLLDSIDIYTNDIEDSADPISETKSKLDSLISSAHLNTILIQDTKEKEDASIELFHLMTVKSQLSELNPSSKLSQSPIHSKKTNWENILAEQQLEIQDLEEKLEDIKAKPIFVKQQDKKANKTKSEDIYNQGSIVDQVISASLESENQYIVRAELDNKGFEDRKAFMSLPLNNSLIKKRFAASSKHITLSSQDSSVKSVCQGKVIYSKKLANKAYTIVIMHDNNYYSVYGNLKTSSVSYGQRVQYNQIIGQAINSNAGNNVLRFEIWKNKKAINPIHWLKNG